jgi:hypothetical protein
MLNFFPRQKHAQMPFSKCASPGCSAADWGDTGGHGGRGRTGSAAHWPESVQPARAIVLGARVTRVTQATDGLMKYCGSDGDWASGGKF